MLTTDPGARGRYVQQLKAFRDRLLHIDTRNPSIFLRKLARKSAFDVRQHMGPAADAVLPKARKAPTEVLLVSDRDETEPAELARAHLVELSRFAAARAEETGLEELFLGFCWVEGFVAPEVHVRGPLALLPVRVDRQPHARPPGWYARFEDSTVQLNRALLGTLRKHKGYAAPEELADRIQQAFADGAASSDAEIQGRVAEAFAATGLPFSLFTSSEIEGMPPRTNADLATLPTGPLQGRAHLVIGMFRQASTALYVDLEEMLRRAVAGEADQGIVDNLLDAGADDPAANPANFGEIDLDEVPDQKLNLVLPSDPSQDQVVVRAQGADCVVVRGPPGTGKSQVIVNLVADALSRGERVLVVCQKRAALDVVFRRMQQVNLADCAYLVHDALADRAAVYGRLAKALSAEPPGPEKAPDLGEMSESVDGAIRSIREIVEPLTAVRHGVQVSALYKRARTGFRPLVAIEPGVVEADRDLEALRDLARRFQPGALRFDGDASPVSRRESWSGKSHAERRELLDGVARLVEQTRRDTAPRRIDDDGERARAIRAAADCERLRTRWYRFLVPRWYGARSTVQRHASHMAPLPHAEWEGALLHAESMRAALAKLRPFMVPAWMDDALGRLERPAELRALAEPLAAIATADFDAVVQHDILRGSTGRSGPLLEQCLAGVPASEDWGEHLRQAVTLAWIEEAEQAFPQLKGQPLERYEALRSKLQSLLDRKREAVAGFLQADFRRRANGGWKKLAYEVGKKRSVKPLRALLTEYTHPLQQVAPCWLASPEVVAEVFPLERGIFDLVIFDEASQLAVERALPVLYRGKRVVVAGDEQQMPPSNFFESVQEDEEGEEGPAEAPDALKIDSLLVLARRVYGQSYLGWHYRSEHQELIEYSNHAFYDGALTVAANVGRDDGHPPIQWLPVPGRWADKRNLEEARKVVEVLHELLREGGEGKPLSVAIVTFNAPQADAVKDEIERRRGVDAGFAGLLLAAENRERIDDRPVVKNIENVQGDERDVVIFSVGYAAGADGVLRKYFGPLSVGGGENRLNVAVTRARKGIYVVCSFDPEILAVETSKNLGPVRFQQYLRYAKAVSSRDPEAFARVIREINPAVKVAASGSPTFDSPFEEQVHDALVRRGFTVHTQVGLSSYRIDLAVVDPRNPSRYCLGIECDGAMFHSGRSVRERDLARQRFLESKGWRIARVWSRNWWLAPEAEIARIAGMLEGAQTAPDRV